MDESSRKKYRMRSIEEQAEYMRRHYPTNAERLADQQRRYRERRRDNRTPLAPIPYVERMRLIAQQDQEAARLRDMKGGK